MILDARARSLRGLVDQPPDLVVEVLSPSTKLQRAPDVVVDLGELW